MKGIELEFKERDEKIMCSMCKHEVQQTVLCTNLMGVGTGMDSNQNFINSSVHCLPVSSFWIILH